MKKQLKVKQYINVALFAAMLTALSACDWFKGKSECLTCGVDGQHSADKSVVLANVAGAPVTVGEFDEFLDELSAVDPQIQTVLQFMPNARQEIFKQYLCQKVILHWVKQDKRDQDIEYKKKYKCACRNIEQELASQIFQKHILGKIEQTDAAAKAFFDENRDKVKEFQHPTFLKKAGGVKVQAVQFTDEKSANAFLEKAKRPNANFAALAKEANKTVNTFGNEAINMQSKNVDNSIKIKLAEVKDVPSVDVIKGDKAFWVVKSIQKVPSEFKPFDEVKETVKQVMIFTKGRDLFTQECDRLKAEYKVDDSKAMAYFEEQRKKKEAEFQEQIKAAQEKAKAEESKDSTKSTEAKKA